MDCIAGGLLLEDSGLRPRRMVERFRTWAVRYGKGSAVHAGSLALERTQKKGIEPRQLAIYCRRRTTKMEIPASVEE